jgi:hypothetical protein
MKLFKLTLTIAVVACFAAATTTEAADISSNGTGGGAWNQAGSWSGGIPGPDDNVTILNGDDIVVNDETASVDTVLVQNGGTLTMQSTVSTQSILVVQNSLKVDSSATFRFNESTYDRPIVRADAARCDLAGEFGGIGSQGGMFDDSGSGHDFEIINSEAVSFTLSNTITVDTAIWCVSGSLTVSTDIENDGEIRADGGTVTFASGSTLNDNSAGWFMVTDDSSTMQFDHNDSTVPSMSAHFRATHGTLDIDESITTSGGCRLDSGTTVAVAGGAVFTATGAYSDPS